MVDAKAQAIVNELANQRDSICSQWGNVIAQLKGEIAERDARWSDVDALKTRLLELSE